MIAPLWTSYHDTGVITIQELHTGRKTLLQLLIKVG